MGGVVTKMKPNIRLSKVIGKDRPHLEYGTSCPSDVVNEVRKAVGISIKHNAELEWADRFVPWGSSGRVVLNAFSTVEEPVDMDGPCGELELDEMWIAVPIADGNSGDLIAWRAKPERRKQKEKKKGERMWKVRAVDRQERTTHDEDLKPAKNMESYVLPQKDLAEHAGQAIAWYQSYAKRRCMERGQVTFY